MSCLLIPDLFLLFHVVEMNCSRNRHSRVHEYAHTQVKFLRHEQCVRAVEICHALAHRCVEPAFVGVADIEWDAYAYADDADLLIVDELAWDRQAAAVCQEDRAAAAAMAAKGKKAASSPAAPAPAPADDSTRLLADVIRLSHRLGGRRPDGYAWAASPMRASARQLSGDCRFAVPLVAAAAACDAILGDAAEALVAHQQNSGYQSSARSASSGSGSSTSTSASRRKGSVQRPTVGLLTLLLRVCWYRSIGLPTALAALNALAPLQSVRDRLLTMRVGPGRARAYEAYFNANDDEQDTSDDRDWADSMVNGASASAGAAKGGADDEEDEDDDDGGDDFVPFLAHRLLLECAQVSPLIAAYSLRLVRSLVRHDLRFLRYAANLLLHVPQPEGEHANTNADAPVAAAHIYIEDVALNLLEAVLSAHALASESEPPEFAATVHGAAFADADAWKKVRASRNGCSSSVCSRYCLLQCLSFPTVGVLDHDVVVIFSHRPPTLPPGARRVAAAAVASRARRGARGRVRTLRRSALHARPRGRD
jgi:hypothetical protein